MKTKIIKLVSPDKMMRFGKVGEIKICPDRTDYYEIHFIWYLYREKNISCFQSDIYAYIPIQEIQESSYLEIIKAIYQYLKHNENIWTISCMDER